MKYNTLLLSVLLIGSTYFGVAQEKRYAEVKKTIIEIMAPHDGAQNSDSIELESSVFDHVGLYSDWKAYKQKNSNDRIKWVLYFDKPVMIRSTTIGGNGRFVNPGDSISITYDKGKRQYAGKGSEVWVFQDEIERILYNTLPKPTKSHVHVNSLEEYFKWKKHLDDQTSLLLPIFNTYQAKTPVLIFNLIKTSTLRRIDFQREETFTALYFVAKKTGQPKLTDLRGIYDSTLNGKWSKWLRSKSDFYGDVFHVYKFNTLNVFKQFDFNINTDSLKVKSIRLYLIYNRIKADYTGLLRERLLQYCLAEDAIKELGLNHPFTRAFLKDYYSENKFPEYKQWMRNFEKKAEKLYNYDLTSSDNYAPDFELVDSNGKNVAKNDVLRGKIALLDFWFSGCTGCVDMVPELQKVENALKNDSNVVFVNISIDMDKNTWLKSVENKKYTTGLGVNLYTNGQGSNHDIIKIFNVNSYPKLYLLNAQGEIVKYPLPDPRKDNGDGLIELIKKEIAKLNDGPYVLYKGDTMLISYIKTSNGKPNKKTEIKEVNENEQPTVVVSTDKHPGTFTVKLKSKLENEPSVFSAVGNQLVLSDIEGNFDAFRKLLQGNKIIDADFNWIFGNGHLVFVGDMFDRGEQVTECLWLIYSLEDKAKKSGGYVHFILGNHEILNLSNDQRYVCDKYKQNVVLLNEKYTTLYGEHSELGRWLRTKNIIEKIGDILYTHAGISRDINNLPLSINQLNDIIRPHYDDRDMFKKNKNVPELQVLFNSATSPFWYRGYYINPSQSSIIDSTLQKFGVRHIVTGHTIVADTVTLHYNGRVINVDTKHAQEKSEALFIEENKFYRTDVKGKRTLLMKQEEPFYLSSSTE